MMSQCCFNPCGKVRAKTLSLALLAFWLTGFLAGQAHAAPRASLVSRHRLALDALRRNDMALLSRLAHPERGVRFSPGVFIQRTGQRFSPRALLSLPRRGPLVWGRHDGNGAPISLSWRAYRKAFVWTHDFRRADLFVNRFKQRGNTRNNLRNFYPGAGFVESFIPASRPGGSDWASLWTAWAKRGNVWRLIGVAHDAWTI